MFEGHREVCQVEVYPRVRRLVQVDGMSIREAARQFGLSRKTVQKMVQFSLPPGYAACAWIPSYKRAGGWRSDSELETSPSSVKSTACRHGRKKASQPKRRPPS